MKVSYYYYSPNKEHGTPNKQQHQAARKEKNKQPTNMETQTQHPTPQISPAASQ